MRCTAELGRTPAVGRVFPVWVAGEADFGGVATGFTAGNSFRGGELCLVRVDCDENGLTGTDMRESELAVAAPAELGRRPGLGWRLDTAGVVVAEGAADTFVDLAGDADFCEGLGLNVFLLAGELISPPGELVPDTECRAELVAEDG